MLSTRTISALLSADVSLPPLARMAPPCGLPSGEDGRGRENRKPMPWRGPAGASPPPGGICFGFGNERAKPLAFPRQGSRKRSAQTNGTPARREAAGRPARGPVGQRASGNERERSACGSAQNRPRPQERAARDRARPHNLPLNSKTAPDRHPHGPGLQARSAQRIEQVARKGSPTHTYSS